MIRDNIEVVLRNIDAIIKKSGRAEGEVKLIAVSKTFGRDAVLAAIDADIKEFGENRIQEAKDKIESIDSAVRWHFIGHLQSNKANIAAQLFDVIHSVDSAKLARQLDKYSGMLGKTLEVLLQVNIGNESQKSGVDPVDAQGVAEEIIKFENIKLTGLMAIPPYSLDKEVTREHYRRLRELKDSINNKLGEVKLTELSMGMSNDFDLAIMEGATYIRVGSAIFGERKRNASPNNKITI